VRVVKYDATTAPRHLAAARSAGYDTRERGLNIVSRANRWMIAGAVGLAGGVTAVTAHAFHTHTATAATTSSAVSSQASQAAQPSQQAPSSGGGLQAPAQAPTQVAPVQPQAPVVSGGS
jgi:hypothetical protein